MINTVHGPPKSPHTTAFRSHRTRLTVHGKEINIKRERASSCPDGDRGSGSIGDDWMID